MRRLEESRATRINDGASGASTNQIADIEIAAPHAL